MRHPTGDDPISGYASGNYGEAGLRAAADAGEFDWGAGLTPKGKENADPRDGGRYHGIPAEEPERIIRMSRDSRI